MYGKQPRFSAARDPKTKGLVGQGEKESFSSSKEESRCTPLQLDQELEGKNGDLQGPSPTRAGGSEDSVGASGVPIMRVFTDHRQDCV